MDTQSLPTKGNLIALKNTLSLSKLGYDLMDKKRNVLIKEIMSLNQKAVQIQESIDIIFREAYAALQNANIIMGINNVERLSHGVPQETSVQIKTRSIMGVEIPLATCPSGENPLPSYGFSNSSYALDEAVSKFNKVKILIMQLATIENSAFRLAAAIKKTQRRANALKNVTIPKYEGIVKDIQSTLEERDRDEFTRLKILKKNKSS